MDHKSLYLKVCVVYLYVCAYDVPVRVVSGYVWEYITRHHTDRYIVYTDSIQPHTGIRRGMHADK